jgi:hypothetical protein
MKITKYLVSALVLIVLWTLSALAQEQAQLSSPPEYRLELISIYDAESEYMFVIGNTGFKSVASLKKFLSVASPGSTLKWAPGCIRFGNEPLLSSVQDMDDFKAFCVAHKINFILVPSG